MPALCYIYSSNYCNLYALFISPYITLLQSLKINNDVNNQQDATTFSFIKLIKSALHVSGDKFAHSQELSFWLYIQLLVQCTGTAADRCHGGNCGTGWQQCRCIVPKAVYTVKNCAWGWANLSPETFRADLKRLINENVVASCWLFTSLY